MKTYSTSFDISFTEEELKGNNPYLSDDGLFKTGYFKQAMAFKEAKQAYKLDQMTPSQREEYILNKKRFQDRIDSECGSIE